MTGPLLTGRGGDEDEEAGADVELVACGFEFGRMRLGPGIEVVGEVWDGAGTPAAGGRARVGEDAGAATGEEEMLPAAAEDTGGAGDIPAPPLNLAAKHFSIRGTSVSPFGVRPRT